MGRSRSRKSGDVDHWQPPVSLAPC